MFILLYSSALLYILNHLADYRIMNESGPFQALLNELMRRYFQACTYCYGRRIELDTLVKKINKWLNKKYIDYDLRIRSIHVTRYIIEHFGRPELQYHYVDLNRTYMRRYVMDIIPPDTPKC